MRLLVLGAIALFLSACSIYKSPVRTSFESRTQGRVKALSVQGECKETGAIPVWFERAFPGHAVELLVSENDLEVWKVSTNDGRVTVRSERALDEGHFESCRRDFSNESEWLANRETYLSALGVPPLD